MTIPKPDPSAGNLIKIATVTGAVVGSVGISMMVLVSPMIIGSLNRGDQDWTRLSEIGEAYGPVSALLAALALVAVSLSLLLQHSQLRHDRLWLQREMNFNLLKVAMDDSSYAQCWGPRVSPVQVDESLFYYVNLILMHWSHASEHRQVSDDQIRRYASALFESEVPRLYWERHGGLRSNARRQDRAFYRIINEEYLKAVAAGPPARPYEPPQQRHRRDDTRHPNSKSPWRTNNSYRPKANANHPLAPSAHQP